jgi:phage regulator Rha-like protein
MAIKNRFKPEHVMNTQTHPDLFPETLLVDCQGSKVFTTSLKVAEHFGKQHKHVLRAIENLIDELRDEPKNGPINERNFAPVNTGGEPKIGPTSVFAERNFMQASYVDQWNRDKPMYRLTERGFSLLTMGFTGKKATEWKVAFLDAFEDMQHQLIASKLRFANAYHQVRPYALPVVEGTEKGLSRTEIAGPLGKSPASVTYHRRQARRFGLLSGGPKVGRQKGGKS